MESDGDKEITQEAYVLEESSIFHTQFFFWALTHLIDSNSWISDSRCTRHMCSRRKWFISLDESKSGKVRMGNLTATEEILGIGNVVICHFDGCKRVLECVRYVPSLRRNLISES